MTATWSFSWKSAAAILGVMFVAGCEDPAQPLKSGPEASAAQLVVDTNLFTNDVRVKAVYLGKCGTRTPDRLPRGEVISAGQSRSFAVDAGCYNILLEGREVGSLNPLDVWLYSKEIEIAPGEVLRVPS